MHVFSRQKLLEIYFWKLSSSWIDATNVLLDRVNPIWLVVNLIIHVNSGQRSSKALPAYVLALIYHGGLDWTIKNSAYNVHRYVSRFKFSYRFQRIGFHQIIEWKWVLHWFPTMTTKFFFMFASWNETSPYDAQFYIFLMESKYLTEHVFFNSNLYQVKFIAVTKAWEIDWQITNDTPNRLYKIVSVSRSARYLICHRRWTIKIVTMPLFDRSTQRRTP
jgi:hypothetical protein